MNTKQIKKRTFRRESDWKALIEEWQQTDKKPAIFCKEKKIAESGFYSWRKRLYPDLSNKRKNPKSLTNLFVPIALTTSEKPANGLILTYPNGCQLQITGATDPSILRMLNQAMGL